MKLKYYMRGLGLGILLTTLILTIGNTKEKLSGQEIIERATKLGMVMKDETNGNLDEILADNNLTGAPTLKPSISPSITPSIMPASGLTPEPTAEPTKAPEASITPTKAPEASVGPTKVPTPEPKPTEVAAAGHGQKATTKIKITISAGMSSRKVSALLLEKDMIKDATDFNEYMMKKGKTGAIKVGTFTISKGASYDEIIKVITK